MSVTHSVTIVYFTRTTVSALDRVKPRASEDFYQVRAASVFTCGTVWMYAAVAHTVECDAGCSAVLAQVVATMTTVENWASLLPSLKIEFQKFPWRANWGIVSADPGDSGISGAASVASSASGSTSFGGVGGVAPAASASSSSSSAQPLGLDVRSHAVSGVPTLRLPSLAIDGNFLEAVNLALDDFALHHVDRDMQHIGHQILVVSAGSGVFEVPAALSVITESRMMDIGCGCDLVNVGPVPLHRVPLFVIRHGSATSSSGDVAALPSAAVAAASAAAAVTADAEKQRQRWSRASGSVGDADDAGSVATSVDAFVVGSAPITSRMGAGVGGGGGGGGGGGAAAGGGAGAGGRAAPRAASSGNASGFRRAASGVAIVSIPEAAPAGKQLYESPDWFLTSFFDDSIADYAVPLRASPSTSDYAAVPFRPVPPSRVFSRRGYRLTESSAVLPSALLSILRSSGRAPTPTAAWSPRTVGSSLGSLGLPPMHLGSLKQGKKVRKAVRRSGDGGGLGSAGELRGSPSEASLLHVAGGDGIVPLVGVVGHDDFGYMIAESPGDAAALQCSLHTRVPSSEDLFPWSGLVNRLARVVQSSAMVADAASIGHGSASVLGGDDLSMLGGSSVFTDRIMDMHQRHDKGVFASRASRASATERASVGSMSKVVAPSVYRSVEDISDQSAMVRARRVRCVSWRRLPCCAFVCLTCAVLALSGRTCGIRCCCCAGWTRGVALKLRNRPRHRRCGGQGRWQYLSRIPTLP